MNKHEQADVTVEELQNLLFTIHYLNNVLEHDMKLGPLARIAIKDIAEKNGWKREDIL